jgi:hypothetical protein
VAALTPGHNTHTAYRYGDAASVVLVGLQNVTTGDTLDLGPSGCNLLQVIDRAMIMGTSVFVEIAATWAGTVITMPAGLAGSSGYLLAWGSGIG